MARLLVIAPVLARLRFSIRCINALAWLALWLYDMFLSKDITSELPALARLGEQYPGIIAPKLQRMHRLSKCRVDRCFRCGKRACPIAILPGIAPTITGVAVRRDR
jgi:hypothetical protein